MNQVYLETARLLTQVAPLIFEGGVFALKGGTAINLFVRDLPRLSVDLDLLLIDHRLDRDAALEVINNAIRDAVERLKKRGFQTHAHNARDTGETKLSVRRNKIEVKVEVNVVIRGTVNPVRQTAITPKARDILQADMELPVSSIEDLYGGKLVAALDRQHPRDLFDVMQLFGHEGITPGIRRVFVVYLASHGRPIHEVLSPRLRDISGEYENTFQGMTEEPVEIAALIAARDRLISELNAGLDNREREFLLSIVNNAPNLEILEIEHLEQLPSIQWKIRNIQRLAAADPKKLRTQAEALETLLLKTKP